jgi:hypothetical protein
MKSKKISTLGWTLLLSLAVVSGGSAVMGWGTDDPLPPLPSDPSAATVKLLVARPFTLSEPYTHWYRSEQPSISSGVLLVLEVQDRSLIHPRQGYQPVLQVGTETAEPLNLGELSGHVVALVPAQVGADGQVDLDLTTTPIFYGEPELAERLDLAAVRTRRDSAVDRGILPPSSAAVQAASLGQVHFQDDHQLRLWAADLIEAWSPQEADLVTGLRAPLVGG